MRYPHIIKNRYGVYCFRLVVPLELQRMGAPREIRFSLLTKNQAVLADSFPFVLLSAKSLLRDLHNLALEHKGTMTERSEHMKTIIEMKRIEMRLRDRLEQAEDQQWDELKQRKQAEWALQKRNQQLTDVTSKALQMKGELRAAHEQVSRLTTELSSKAATALPLAIQGSDELLSELITAYLAFCANQLKRKPKTLLLRESNLNRFLDIIGDMPCNRLSAEVSRPPEPPQQPLAKRNVNLSIHSASIKQNSLQYQTANGQTF